jgi:dipeptidyl aminopeptidase/acylaminoacyl peptidase
LGTLRFSDNARRRFLNRSLEREVDQDGYRSLTMVDPWTGEVIANLGTAAGRYSRAAWSPDGRLFAFTATSGDRDQFEDIHVVDDQGRGGRVSEFGMLFTDFDVRMLEWSPDGQLIALWARTHPPSDVGFGERLDFFAFDVRSRTLLDYCLARSSRSTFGVGQGFDAIWAPDSTSVIVPTFSDIPELVIDIATGETREIPVGTSVWAWGP